MRKYKYLQPFRYSTRERSIGLGENIIVFDLLPSEPPFAEAFFEKTPAVGWYAFTYGRMNGFLANIVYPLEDSTSNVRVLEKLKDAGLISDYMILDLLSYPTKGWDFSKFDSTGRWRWDWQKWYDRIDSILRNGDSNFVFEAREQTQIPFDSKDVHLIKMLHENPKVTQKQMSVELDLPISQVRRRFQRLQDLRVILGYKPIFTPFKDTLTLMCFIESVSSVEQILACIYELPYTLDIYVESSTRIGIRIRLSTIDIVGFFKGLDRIRHLADSLSMQILHSIVSFGSLRLYDLYSASESKWITHSSDYYDWLEDWLNAI